MFLALQYHLYKREKHITYIALFNNDLMIIDKSRLRTLFTRI
jgi:hypothetical protein